MTLAASVTWSFSGNVVTVNVGITGGTPDYDVIYGWDDGASTPHNTSSTSDSASHTYGVYDYDDEPFFGAYPHQITIVVGDDVGAAVFLVLGLPVPRPLLTFAPENGPPPLAVAVTGSNLRTSGDPSDDYPSGVTDVSYDYASDDGWTYSAGGPGTVAHTWTANGVRFTNLRIVNSLGWAKTYGPIGLPVVQNTRLRQFPRDDVLGGAPRQVRHSRSTQGSARQGWVGTYR